MAAISSKAILKTTNPYKYNAGSELEEELNYYNTFYRKNDAQIGRFTGVDIRSEESAGMSVYNFGANNPVMFNDPLGDKFGGTGNSRGSQMDAHPIDANWNYGTNQGAGNGFGGLGDSGGGGGGFGNGPYGVYWRNIWQRAPIGFSSTDPKNAMASASQEVVAFYYALTYSSSMDNVSATTTNGGFNINYTATTKGNSYTDYFVSTESLTKDFQFLNELYGEASGNANSGGMTFPSFSTLWNNYPQDVNGSHAHPSSDPYPNQCAIRVGDAFMKSGIDMSSYPKVNKTSDGYPRSSKGLADWTWQNFGKPKIMSQGAFERDYKNSTGLMYIAPSTGGVGHIDLFNAGTTGSGYYLGSQIWFWPIK